MKRQPRPDDANAFLPETARKMRSMPEQDAESIAEEFIGSATTGESVSEDARDEVVDEEEGGPFIVLDDEAHLPTTPEEQKPESDGHESVQKEERIRAARWMASRNRS